MQPVQYIGFLAGLQEDCTENTAYFLKIFGLHCRKPRDKVKGRPDTPAERTETMAKIKDEFAAASRREQVRYCTYKIEELAEAGASDRKIRQKLKELGASGEVVEDAWYEALDEGLPEERERALRLAEKTVRSAKNLMIGEQETVGDGTDQVQLTDKLLRRVASRLSYQGYGGEVVYDTLDQVRRKYGD